MKTTRRILALLLAFAMIVGMLPVQVLAYDGAEGETSVMDDSLPEAEEAEGSSAQEAEEAPPEGEEAAPEQTEDSSDGEGTSEPAPKKNKTDDVVTDTTERTETVSVREKESPKEDLFLGYLERQPGKNGLKTQAKTKRARDKLTGVEAKLYQLLEAEIVKIAAGERASTEFTFTGEELGIQQQRYTEAELGVTIGEVVDGKAQLRAEAMEAAMTKAGAKDIDYISVLSALRTDHPYEYYWQDYTKNTISARDDSFGGGTDNDEWYITYDCTLTVKMPVYSDYAVQGEEYTVDTTIAQSAKQTVTRAQEVVDAHANESNLEKLNAYRQYICEQVTYNQAAANREVGDIGNPWQLIWVFDNDESTNVVCEGYSKAFQFLCDLSSFRGNLYSLCAVGTMESGGTSGSHMWNILHMDDGKNYLADVTNCDGNSIGAPAQLFLAGAASGSYAEGYTYACEHGDVTYTYGVETPQLYSEEELTMSTSAYQEPQPVVVVASGTCGDSLTWTLDDAGTLTISGSGSMSDNGSTFVVPWSANTAQIRALALPEGLTSIGAYAFANCNNLTSVTIPSTVTTIGMSAFAYTALTNVTIPSTVTSLGIGAFSNCKSLSTVTLPAQFEGKKVQCFDGTPWLADNGPVRGNCGNNATWTYDKATSALTISGTGEVEMPVMEDDFRSYYKNDMKSVVVDDGITVLGAFVLSDCGQLTSAQLPEGLLTIERGALAHCSCLEEIQIPATVTTIGQEAFYGCDSLTNLTIPGNVTAIGQNAFTNCFGLSTVTISEGVTSIGASAFYGCPNLENVIIPRSVAEIGANAFARKLSYVVLSISGYTGSAAETYANDNNIPFVSLGEPEQGLLAGLIGRIEVGDITRFSRDRFDFDEDGNHWWKLDCWPGGDNLTVVLKDGAEFRLEDYEVEDGGDDYDPMDAMKNDIVAHVNEAESLNIDPETVHFGWDSDEQRGEEWGAGTYEARIRLERETQGDEPEDCFEQSYDVQVVELQSIEAESLTQSIYNRCERDDENDPNNGKLECWPNEVRLTISEGSGVVKSFPKDGYMDTKGIEDALREEYPHLRNIYFDWRSDESDEKPAEDGTEFNVRFFLWPYYDPEHPDSKDNIYASYTVTVEDRNPIEWATVDDITRYENDRYDGGEVECNPDEENSVTLKLKGMDEPITGSFGEVQERLHHMDCGIDELWTDSEEHPEIEGARWTAGHTYTARLMARVHGDEIELCSFDVHVVAFEATITGVSWGRTVRWRQDREETRSEDEDGNEETWDFYDTTPDDLTISVQLPGEEEIETFTGDFWRVKGELDDWLEKNGYSRRFPMDWFGYNIQENTEGHWQASSTGNTYYAQLLVNGVDYRYPVEIWDHPVADMTVQNISRFASDRHTLEEYLENENEDEDDEVWYWNRVDCWPDEITVTLKDGFQDKNGKSTFTGDMEDAEEWMRDACGFDAQLEWDSDEEPVLGDDQTPAANHTYEGNWTRAVSHSNGAWVYMRNYQEEGDPSWPYDVTVIDSPVASVMVGDIEVFETYFDEREDWDDEAEDWVRWNQLDCWPDTISVTLTEQYTDDAGRPLSKTGNPDEVEEWLRNIAGNDAGRTNFHWESNQEEDRKPIVVGRNFTKGRFYVCGVESNEYDVSVKESPVGSLTVDPLTVMSNQRETVDWEDRDEWDRYVCEPDRITVKLRAEYATQTDVAQKSGAPWEVRDWLEDEFGFDADRGSGKWWESDEHPAQDGEPEYFWTVDNIPDEGILYQDGAAYHFGGAEARYDVTIVNTPDVVINDIPDVWRLNTDRYRQRYDGEDDEDGCDFRRVDCWPETFTAAINGKTYTGDLDELEEQFREDYPGYRIECGWNSDEKPNTEAERDEDGCYPGSWQTGAHTAWVYILGVRKDFTVHVVNPGDVVASVTVPNTITRLDSDRFEVEDWAVGLDGTEQEVRWQKLDCYLDDVQVRLVGGSTYDSHDYEGNLDWMSGEIEQYLRANGYPGIRIDWEWDSYEVPREVSGGQWRGSYEPYSKPYAVMFCFAGVEKQYGVYVVDPDEIIQSVTVSDATRFETDRFEEERFIEGQTVKWLKLVEVPGRVQITLKNGTTYDSDSEEYKGDVGHMCEDVEAAIRQMNPDLRVNWYWDSDEEPEQDANGKWVGSYTAGNNCPARFCFGGAEYPITIEVVHTPNSVITVDDATAQVGQEVEIPVRLEENHGVAGMALVFTIPEGVTLNDISFNEGLADCGEFNRNNNIITWYSEENVHWDSEILRLYVTASQPGEYTIGVALKNGNPTNFSDEYAQNMPVEFHAGTLSVVEPTHVHTLKHVEAEEPTCTEGGNVEYWECSECHEKFLNATGTDVTTNTDLPATGHGTTGTELRNKKNATCEEPGYTGDTYCLKCGAKMMDGEVIPAKGHTLTKTEARDPTCTTPGNDAYYFCTGCRKYFADANAETEIDPVIAATGHKLVKTEAVAATCTTEGNLAYWTCSECQKIFSDEGGTNEIDQKDTIVPFLGHTLTRTEAKDPTCTEGGNAAYWECGRCHEKFSDAAGTNVTTNTDLPAKGHRLVKTEATEPTCTEDGNIAYWTCENCHKFFQEEACKTELTRADIVLVAAGHSYNAEVTAPTCTEKGYTTYTCEKCENSYKANYTDALGHKFDNGVVTTEPTETTEGVKTYTCQRCQATKTEDIPVITHRFDEGVVTKAATCTAEGVKTFTCQDSGCGKSYTETIPALGHNYKQTVVPATCKEKGYTNYACTRCGVTYQDNYTELAAHKLTKTEAKAATCTQDGNIAYWTCSVCGKLFKDAAGTAEITRNDTVVVKTGHLVHEEKERAEATCTQNGSVTYWCSECHGDEYTVTLPATGHNWEKVEIVAPTCKEEGYTLYKCKNCNEPEKQDSKPRVAHQYEAVVTKEAELGVKGERTYTCQVCRDRYTEEIPALKLKIILFGLELTFDGKTLTIKGSGSMRLFGNVFLNLTTQEANLAPQSAGLRTQDGDEEQLAEQQRAQLAQLKGQLNQVERIEIGEGVTSVAGLSGCTNATSISLPESLEKIEEGALAGTKIESVKIPDSVTEIGENAFQGCVNLQNVTLGKSTEKIEGGAFQGCTGLENVVVPSSVTEIGVNAFENVMLKAESGSVAATYAVANANVKLTTMDAGDPCASGNHSYEETVTEPTCKKQGFTVHKCTRCDDSYKDTYTAPNPALHQYNNGEVTTKPGCETTGEKTFTCTECSATKTEEIPALGHDYSVETTVEPNCTKRGYTNHKCIRCDASYTDSNVAAKGHVTEEHEAHAASCTEDGNLAYWKCSVCSHTFRDSAGRSAVDEDEQYTTACHHWDSGKTTMTALDGKTGVKVYTCSACQKTKTVGTVATIKKKGDFNGDNDVTMADVILGNRAVVGLIELTPEQQSQVKVTTDGTSYTMADVVKMNRFVIKKINSLT